MTAYPQFENAEGRKLHALIENRTNKAASYSKTAGARFKNEASSSKILNKSIDLAAMAPLKGRLSFASPDINNNNKSAAELAPMETPREIAIREFQAGDQSERNS